MYIAGGALLPQSSPAAIGYSRHVLRALTPISSPFWRIHENRSQSLKLMASISTEAEKPKPWLWEALQRHPSQCWYLARDVVGFELVTFVAEAERIATSGVTFKSCFGKGFIGDVPVMLAKPQTFMNARGESVGAFASCYKIPLKQVLVILNDMDLPFGKLRLLPKGGHAGHNGMRSIMSHFKGSRDFPRLRIGIGRPPGKMDPVNFVIRPFDGEDTEELDFTFQNGLKAVRNLVQENFNKAATFVNSSTKSLEKL